MLSTVKIFLLVLELAKWLSDYVHDRKLITQGENNKALEILTVVTSRAQKARDIEEAYAKKSQEEIARSLEGDFRD